METGGVDLSLKRKLPLWVVRGWSPYRLPVAASEPHRSWNSRSAFHFWPNGKCSLTACQCTLQCSHAWEGFIDLSSLLHYGQALDVESVMVGGNWIMKDWIVLTMDGEATIADA